MRQNSDEGVTPDRPPQFRLGDEVISGGLPWDVVAVRWDSTTKSYRYSLARSKLVSNVHEDNLLRSHPEKKQQVLPLFPWLDEGAQQ